MVMSLEDSVHELFQERKLMGEEKKGLTLIDRSHSIGLWPDSCVSSDTFVCIRFEFDLEDTLGNTCR
jgi:hypothetical protein